MRDFPEPLARSLNCAKAIPVVGLDTETTGREGSSEIVQIAFTFETAAVCASAVRWRGEQFQSLVKPRVPISPFASDVHKIYARDVAEADEWNAVAARARAFLTPFVEASGRLLVLCHNASFDMGRLRHMISTYGASPFEPSWRVQILCTLTLSRRCVPFWRSNQESNPNRTSEPKACAKLWFVFREITNHDLDGAHNALVDARACRHILMSESVVTNKLKPEDLKDFSLTKTTNKRAAESSGPSRKRLRGRFI